VLALLCYRLVHLLVVNYYYFRLDVQICLPNVELLLDVSGVGVHHISPSTLKVTTSFCNELQVAEGIAGGDNARNPLRRRSSPAVSSAEKVKHLRYEPMMVMDAKI
jgi:hypothetical protein